MRVRGRCSGRGSEGPLSEDGFCEVALGNDSLRVGASADDRPGVLSDSGLSDSGLSHGALSDGVLSDGVPSDTDHRCGRYIQAIASTVPGQRNGRTVSIREETVRIGCVRGSWQSGMRSRLGFSLRS